MAAHSPGQRWTAPLYIRANRGRSIPHLQNRIQNRTEQNKKKKERESKYKIQYCVALLFAKNQI